MKRAMIVILLVLVARADARRVIHIPTLAELCPGNDSWDRVAQRIRRQSPFTLERDGAAIKVVNIDAGMLGRHSLSGIYVYRFDKKWTLHGELRVYQPRDLLRVERVTFGARTGYRLDVGVTTDMPFSFDDETTIRGVLRQQLTLLCFDEGGCQQIVTACDVLVHGKAYSSFRGTLRYIDRQLRVVGDRRNAGAMCAQPEFVLVD
jgi:hypothetical protein